jgi:uncharacterized HAD superfamily protein
VKKIYVDVDDVLSQTIEMYIDIADAQFGQRVPLERIRTFDLKTSFDLTEAQFLYLFDLAHRPDCIMAYAPVQGAVAALNAWKTAGHHIDIVTGRPTSTRESTLAWLRKTGVPFDSFTMVDKYNRPGNDQTLSVTKAELAARPFDLAVEDSVDMALYLAGQMGVKTVLVDRPWNRACPDHGNLVRQERWDDIFAMA